MTKVNPYANVAPQIFIGVAPVREEAPQKPATPAVEETQKAVVVNPPKGSTAWKVTKYAFGILTALAAIVLGVFGKNAYQNNLDLDQASTATKTDFEGAYTSAAEMSSTAYTYARDYAINPTLTLFQETIPAKAIDLKTAYCTATNDPASYVNYLHSTWICG